MIYQILKSGNEDGEMELQQPEYSTGDYLKLMNHLICLPLEPGMGNLHIRNSQRVMIRFFTSTSAIELGTFFQDLALVQDLPVLRLSFPVIGRQVRGARSFRAKVPATMNFTLLIKRERRVRSDIKTKPPPLISAARGCHLRFRKKNKAYLRR